MEAKMHSHRIIQIHEVFLNNHLCAWSFWLSESEGPSVIVYLPAYFQTKNLFQAWHSHSKAAALPHFQELLHGAKVSGCRVLPADVSGHNMEAVQARPNLCLNAFFIVIHNTQPDNNTGIMLSFIGPHPVYGDSTYFPSSYTALEPLSRSMQRVGS